VKKDRQLFSDCRRKISEVIENPHRYKHLKYEDRFRVHVGGSFVLTYRIIEDRKTILFLDLTIMSGPICTEKEGAGTIT
jgi:mRNA-degrading endonuclease RelE of RelBE toxin-antitoxin system